MKKEDLLNNSIEQFDIKQIDCTDLIVSYKNMAFQARNIARGAEIFAQMSEDKDCCVILTLAGSLFSAGLKKVVYDLIDSDMVDAIVSTGAIMVDQDFFEALGFEHYQGSIYSDDNDLMELGIDRIYDTFIDEDQLRICDRKIAEIADNLQPRPYSSREFIAEMGKYLQQNNLGEGSVVRKAYEKSLPIFIPAFSDCSAGFGLVYHQWTRENQAKVSIDSAADFLELTKVKIAAGDTGLFMIGGGVPKNFAQDVVVSADFVGHKASMHKYAVQITVADERDGGLSGSTLREAHSWGKVETINEQMVFSEASIALPIIASYAYHKIINSNRKGRQFSNLFESK